jgi:hypothetical protein
MNTAGTLSCFISPPSHPLKEIDCRSKSKVPATEDTEETKETKETGATKHDLYLFVYKYFCVSL